MNWIAADLPRTWAGLRSRSRIIGVVYLLYFLTAILGGIFTPGTASKILAQESLFRFGFALTLISVLFYLALAALFYHLFAPVNKNVALVAAFFGILGCVMQVVGSLFQLGPLVLLGGSSYLNAFSAKQLQALAQLFLDMNGQAGTIGIVVFALFDILIGYLILRSTFLPRILGALMVLAGLGWLTFLSPALANNLSPPIDILGFGAEALLMLWLLLVGVDTRKAGDVRGG